MIWGAIAAVVVAPVSLSARITDRAMKSATTVRIVASIGPIAAMAITVAVVMAPGYAGREPPGIRARQRCSVNYASLCED